MHKIIAPLFFLAALLAVSYCANKSIRASASSERLEFKQDREAAKANPLGFIEEKTFNSNIPMTLKSLGVSAGQETAEETWAGQEKNEEVSLGLRAAKVAYIEQKVDNVARAFEQKIISEKNLSTESYENNSSPKMKSEYLKASVKKESSPELFEKEQVPDEKESQAKNKKAAWQKIRPGLEYMLLPEPKGESFVIVAISPELYAFTLHMASEEGEAMSLKTWAKQHGLLAAINASMYLPDRITSTGHMKSSTHVNNDHIGSRLGAFFVAEPRQKDLALVDILETDDSSWEERFDQYELRVQNFRILSRDGALQWKDASSRHSVAAIGKSSKGKVFFILATRAMSIPDFASKLKESLADLSTVIYVEGSDKAALYLQLSADSEYLWQGRKNLFNFPADPHLTLPNIIGIRSRSQ